MTRPVFLLLCALCFTTTAHAATPRIHDPVWLAAVDWSELSPEERELLRKHRKKWDRYSSDNQERMRDGARRYLHMSPEQQRQVQDRKNRYEQLSPAEKKRLREQYLRDRGKH